MSTTDVTAEVQEPIDAPVPETAEQVTEQPPAEEQAESVEQQQQQQQQPVVEQVETSASVAAAAGPAPPPVFAAANGVYSKPESWIPEEAEVSLAKAFLKSSTTNSDANLYNHLVTLVMRVLESRPANALDVFESLSADIKRNKFKVQQNNAPSSFKIVPQTSEELLLAQSRSKLFERLDSDDADEGEIPDLLEISKLWEWAGVSLANYSTLLGKKKPFFYFYH